MNFTIAHAFTARFEGGLSDHPSDPGGITKYGISLRWLEQQDQDEADLNHDGTIDAADIRALTPEQAAKLFRRHFWDAQGLDDYPLELGCCLYDCMVNTGLSRTARMAQELCNHLYAERADRGLGDLMPLGVDGVLGVKSRQALLYCVEHCGCLLLCDALLDARMDFYQHLSNSRPQQYKVFLKGWLRRAHALREYIRTPELGGKDSK